MAKVIDKMLGREARLDVSALTVAADPEVRAAREAEEAAVRRAHDAEEAVAGLEVAERTADESYDQATASGDEAATREGRRRWIGAQEAARAQRETVKRLQRAAVAARQKREAVELEAAQRVADRARERLAVLAARIVKVVEGELHPAFEEGEQLIDALDALAAWGSPTAQRIGWVGGLGHAGKALFRGRGLTAATGAHTLSALCLEDRFAQEGGLWGQWKREARSCGLIEE